MIKSIISVSKEVIKVALKIEKVTKSQVLNFKLFKNVQNIDLFLNCFITS